MDHDPAELSQERATSSEPCSTRPNPFNDNEASARKRQRVSRKGSRSRSVDTPRASIATPDSMDLQEETPKSDSEPAPPHTPPPNGSEPSPPPEPNSSRVTINLRTTRPLESIPSSPISPTAASRMVNGEEDVNTRISVESSTDGLSTIPVETPISSPSAIGSPEIELVTLNDEDDYSSHSPPVAIINDIDLVEDAMLSFPYFEGHLNLEQTLAKVIRYVQYEVLETEETFGKLRDWIDTYLHSIGKYVEVWYDSYSKYRDFWKQFPLVVVGLSLRSRFFGPFLSSTQRTSRSLSEFLCQFARLTARFVNMDVWALEKLAQRSENDTVPDLVSTAYLAAFGHLLRKEEAPNIGKNLETHYDWNWDEEVRLLSTTFQAEGGNILPLTKLTEGLLKYVSQNPKTIDNLVENCKIVQQNLEQIFRVLHDADRIHQQDVDLARNQLAHGYRFYEVMADGLTSIIEKQVTSLAPEAAMIMLNSLAYMLMKILSYDDDAERPLLETARREQNQIPLRLLPMVVATHWKFTILKKLIMSTQMQLRVNGVTTMCSELLRLWNENKNMEPSQAPVLLCFANFIIDNRIIEYLVGIGSHPEIINESYNILGFLIVTKTYTDSQAATTWETVTSSQDPRVVDALLKMLKNCFNLQNYSSLLLICQQVNTLPMGAFTPAMREFLAALIRELMLKASNDSFACLDAPPYELCVRLVRESSRTSTEFPSGQPDVQNFAGGRLRELLSHGPASDIRHQIYSECIVDVAARTETASGSICVINALLRQNVTTDIRILTTEHGLTKLVIQELESAAAESQQSLAKDSPASVARRELVRNIIIHEPGTISPTLGSQLWKLLVGEGSGSVIDRNTSWQILNTIMKKSSFDNVFLETCFKDHLPALPPSCFAIGTLDFVREAIVSWLDKVRPNFLEEDRTFEDLALDQLWRIILEAPASTIDAPAIGILVEVYVESSLILSLPRAKAKAIHLALVDRCLKQLATAASKLKSYDRENIPGKETDDMLLDDSGGDFQTQEMIFARSLAVLREFLRAYQSKPQFATPKSKPLPPMATSAKDGEKITIKYQTFDGDTHSDVTDFTIGKLDPVASVFAQLEKETGFNNYKVYCNGKVVDPEEVGVCKSMEDLNFSGLVLIQRREGQDGSTNVIAGSKTTLEFEIMKHFDELWGYLGMHETVAKEIYLFLVKFPVYERLQQDLASDSVLYSSIFPQSQPFKSLYAIHALREYTVTQAQTGNIDEVALKRAISLLAAVISDPDVVNSCPGQGLKDSLALHLVDLFIDLLREPVLPISMTLSLDDVLLKRLTRMLYQAKSDTSSQINVNLTCKCFEAILEASLHNPELWASFKVHLEDTTLLRELLLDDPRMVIRKSVAKQIITKCSFNQGSVRVSTDEFTVVFWPMVSALVPITTQLPYQCDELFSLCHALFKRLGDTSYLDSISLQDLLWEWTDLLLSHTSNERVDQPESVDLIIHGLANLCQCVVQFSKILRQPLASSAIGAKLFRKHLFPDLALDLEDQDYPIQPTIPLLNTISRHTIGEIIFFLVKDDAIGYKKILDLLQTLVPYDRIDEGPYVYDLPHLFERNRSVRSSTGYVGLRNLSNTCYLNSLLTQLFMNVPFRDFMLTSRLADGGSSQRLLSETQSLFSYMQTTLKRFVDPSSLASSIRTWDDANIDVNVQMDVDEFYNLLFDRWESQFLAEDDKRKFRSFYSGQLLQQVKSKECPHISERQETFAAISCDVKGKTCLNESLQAYVDGEVMEGDNKYKCSTCDRHVDAVKRTCLKDLPDNLLFHLKRFDYNLRTGQRSKLNDHFTFPDEIDMRPYKVEHLIDTPDQSPPDVFELVGILVHSGTAESGHYFSYIKERPSNTDQPRWVEFNDDLVSRWDPGFKEAKCFGGYDMASGNFQIEKQYSAYMLFYQRTSALRSQEQALARSGKTIPVRLPLIPRLHNHIEMENELLMRKHCLYDPSHSNFVNKMLSNIKNINKGRCSESHDLEKSALVTALNHLDQVVSRAKDTPDFVTAMLAIRQICHTCAECSRDFLEWFCDRPDALRNLLLRNPEALIRTEMASSILSALTKVKVEIPYAYGLSPEEDDGNDEIRLIHKVVETINILWDQFHSSCRAWPEYFGLLGSIAKLGEHEAAILMDFGFLRKVIEVMSADLNLSASNQYTRMLNIVSKRVATRPVSYDAVINLLYRLLKVCDLTVPPMHNNEERLELVMTDSPVPMTDFEMKLMLQHWVRGQIHILTEKLLQLNQNHYATTNILIILLQYMPSVDFNIYQAINHGIRKLTAHIPCAPFLRAAITYCEHSGEPDAIHKMITYVAKITAGLENMEGREFVQFFKDIIELPSNKNDLTKDDILKIVVDLIPTWAPGLLNYFDPTVRENTEIMLSEILFNTALELDSMNGEESEKATHITRIIQNLGVACLNHLQESYVVPSQQAVRFTLENMLRVIETCGSYFDEDDLDSHFAVRKLAVLPALRKITVEEHEEETSDWDNSDGEYPSSEPMDSITELVPADDLEMDLPT